MSNFEKLIKVLIFSVSFFENRVNFECYLFLRIVQGPVFILVWDMSLDKLREVVFQEG
jgi:hypothetical protein